jgi:DNA polymerase elongation subunit (family B)
MSSLTKLDIKNFLVKKQGYIKKSPIHVAKAIWKRSDKYILPKNTHDLQKDLDLIRDVQSHLRVAQNIRHEEDHMLAQTYDKILQKKNAPKRRLYFDIEVSPNVVYSWGLGKTYLTHESIISERAVICVCYKWAGDDKVHSLSWNNGDDKALLANFAKVINSADEIVTQNGDSFDVKWLRTRCLYHDIDMSPKFNSIDTLKMAKAGFRFNSNKLDYMGSYLGLGKKIKTDFDLWKQIHLNNSKEAMNKMVEYCKEDVRLLERVHGKLQKLSPVKKFKYKKIL